MLQLVLGVVFLYSAVTKFLDIYLFGEILRSYGLLPDGLIKPLAILLPILELLLGAALFLRRTARVAALGVMVLSLLFGFGLLMNWGEVMPYGCGCFGPTEAATVGILDVGKDVLLLAAGASLFVLAGKRKHAM